MSKPEFTLSIEVNNHKYEINVFQGTDFGSLQNVGQVYGFVVSRDKKSVLLVKNKALRWNLPGGTVEVGETLLETLVREVKEETSRTILLSTALPYYYQETFEVVANGERMPLGIQVRFVVMVDEDIPFVSDPDGDVVLAQWVPIQEVACLLDWGKTSDMLEKTIQSMTVKL